MMDLSNPLRSLAPGVESDALRVLARTEAPLTGARVADLAGRSHTQVREVLARLVHAGLVTSERLGQAYAYELNRDHVLAECVVAMVAAVGLVEQRLRDEVAGWPVEPVAVVLFGSAARRDGDADSDIDLLVVRPDEVADDDDRWEQARYDLARAIERWSGNTAQVIELSEAEVVASLETDEPLMKDISSEGVVLAGSDRIFSAPTVAP